jgi:single-stranded-DNA-specific exonuclease
MSKKWIFRELPPYEEVNLLANELKIDKVLATLLIQRNVKTFEEAHTFFRPELQKLHDPFLMKDMDKAVLRIERAFRKREKILIYGDYDVDGTTAIALVYGVLHTYHPYLDYYAPDRYQEGYGISQKAIDWAKSENFSLIIALDCGIKSMELVDYAYNLGIDFIICDHHIPAEILPKAVAILDPKRPDCDYPFKELSGCGIGFKLMQAFCIHNELPLERLYDFLDLVVVSIASDLVSIKGENRILAYNGLAKLNQNPRIGLKALIDIAGFGKDAFLEISNLVFTIGPRINAVGRMAHAKQAIELLTIHNKSDADKFAHIINQINLERRDLDNISTQEAFDMIEENIAKGNNPKSHILFKADWHGGIVGIMASRCVDKFYKPTIILNAHDEERITGSGRSIHSFNMHEALEYCADLLMDFGGHHQAVGLTLKKENLDKFIEKYNEYVEKEVAETDHLLKPLDVDFKINFDEITPKFFRILKQFSPFGPDNMRPVFMSENIIVHNPQILKEKHLKFTAKQANNQHSFVVIAFGMAEFYSKIVDTSQQINICYSIEENHFQGKTNLQLRVKDIEIMEN